MDDRKAGAARGWLTLTIQGADSLTRAGPAACRKKFQGPCPVRGYGQVHAGCSTSEAARPGEFGWPRNAGLLPRLTASGVDRM